MPGTSKTEADDVFHAKNSEADAGVDDPKRAEATGKAAAAKVAGGAGGLLAKFTGLKIATKLYAGFATVLLAVTAMATLTILEVEHLSENFKSYSGMASDAVLVSELETSLKELQLDAREYMASSSEKDMNQFRKGEQNTRKLLETAKKEIQKPERAQLVKEIDEELIKYVDGFNKIVALLQQRNELVAKILDPTGAQIREKLSKIGKGAFQSGDYESASHAGIVQEDLLLARLYATKFLLSNDVADVQRVREEFAQLDKALVNLDRSLQNPERRQLLSEVKADLPRYLDTFEKVAATILERNKIRKEVLDHDAQLIFERAEKIKDSVKKDEEALKIETASSVNNAETEEVIIALLTVVMGIILAYVISRSVSGPIDRLSSAMMRLAKGDKTIEIPGQDVQNETGDMARTVQVFKESMIETERLQAQQRESEKKALEDEKRRETEKFEAERKEAEQRERDAAERQERADRIEKMIADFDKEVSTAISAVASAASEMQASAQTLSSSAEQTSRQATAVAAASEEATTNVQTVASATEELSASIQEISRQVTQSNQISQNAVEEAKQANAKVEGLAEAAQKIGDVVNLINDIASQTNLLALNATIEAARAGEAGKGFAVVASEVKSLATQTGKATEEIGAQITAIQSATNDAVQAIQGIGSTISQIGEIATSVASAVEEQGAATGEIATNVQQAAAGTQEVTNNISQVTQAAGESQTSSAQMLDAANSLAQQGEVLRHEVDKFLKNVRAA